MSFTLRPMQSRDVPVVTAIDRLSFPTPWSASAFRRELEREQSSYFVLLRPREDVSGASASKTGSWLRRIIGPKEGSRVIGYVGFRLQGERGHITTIALHPDWRGRGFGDFLLSVALRQMLAHGAQVVTLEMRPSNEIAHRLYLKYGFQVVQSRRQYYRDGQDAWVMAVSVDNPRYREKLAQLRQALDDRFKGQDIDVGQMTGEPL